MKMQPIGSSNIDSVGYDEFDQKLTIRFKSGRTYTYQGVSKETFDAFMDAEAKSSFFAQIIKLNYNYSIEGEKDLWD